MKGMGALLECACEEPGRADHGPERPSRHSRDDPSERRGNRTRKGARPEPAVDVIVLTAGRRAYLDRTLASFAECVHGPVVHAGVFDDSGDERFGRWLSARCPGWDIITTPGHIGFTRAVRAAWEHERRRGGAPYIFHLEEDFVFDRRVDLLEMIAVLEQDPMLAQVALLRGPFFSSEMDVGGIVQEDPDAYAARRAGELAWLEHRKTFTTNPCLYRRTLLNTRWPDVAHSESAFSRQLVRRGHRFAFMGNGETWVTHIGVERTQHGY